MHHRAVTIAGMDELPRHAGDPAEIGAPLPLDALSDDAQSLYRAAADAYGAYKVTVDEHRDAAEELAAANLARVHWNGPDWKPGEGTLSIVRLHRAYFVAAGRGPLTVEVRVGRDDRPALLGFLTGVSMHRFDRDPHKWRVVTRHPTMTDAEHAATILADLTVDLVTFADVDGWGRTHLRGVLTELRAWPLGGSLGDDLEWCTYCAEHGNGAHPIGPYLPPERADLDGLHGSIVTLVLSTGPEPS